MKGPSSGRKAAGNFSSLRTRLPLVVVASHGTDLEASMCEVRGLWDHPGPDLPGRSNETCDKRLHWCQEYILLRQAEKRVSNTFSAVVAIGRTRLRRFVSRAHCPG
ncbi:hypothetical protein N431DRAFT_434995 [Stipitochalara longipes BDJ]|nr:hypothetical protein N431DRAFT_434995 [Stipitochalara longipes BDJ]